VSVRRSTAVSASAALAVLLGGSFVQAQPVTYDLEYGADSSCPSQPTLVHWIAQRSRNAELSPGGAERHLVVRIARSGLDWRGEIELGPNEAPRRVSGQTCDSVARALALIAAVSLDPAIVLELAPPSPAPPAPSGAPASPPLERPTLPAEPASRAEHAILFGTQGSATSGPAPTALYGVGAFAGIELERRVGPAFRLDVSRSSTFARDVGSGTVRFTLTSGRLEACPGALATGPVLLGGCVDAVAGALVAEGFARGTVEQPGSVSRLWLELGLSSRISVLVAERTRLELFGGVGLPLTRRAYVFENPREVVHEPPLLVGRLGVGLAADLP